MCTSIIMITSGIIGFPFHYSILLCCSLLARFSLFLISRRLNEFNFRRFCTSQYFEYRMRHYENRYHETCKLRLTNFFPPKTWKIAIHSYRFGASSTSIVGWLNMWPKNVEKSPRLPFFTRKYNLCMREFA